MTKNPTITINQGDTVVISLTSTDTTHQFALDIDQDGTMFLDTCPTGDMCSAPFSPSTPTSITIPGTLSHGSYKYFCTIHSSMVGNFIVLAPPTPDFGVTSNPTALTLVQGTSGRSTMSVAGQNGFSGTINLSSSISPTSTNGPTFSLNPPSVSISSGNPQTSTLIANSTSSTPTGSYTITVTVSNSTTQRTTTVMVTINAPASPDFSIASNPTSLNIASGGTGTATLTITGLNGFSGTVNFAGSVSPSGPTVSFSPSSVTLSAGSATSTLTVSAAMGHYGTVANGSYSVSVTAISGSLSHSTTVQATVGSSNPSTGTLPLSPALLVGIVAVIVAAVAVTVFLIRRKPSR